MTADVAGQASRFGAFRSVRSQVIGTMVLLVVVGLAVSGFLSYTVQLNFVDERVAQDVSQEIQEFRELAASELNPLTGQPWQGVEEVLAVAVDSSVPEENQTLAGVVDGELAYFSVGGEAGALRSEPDVVAELAASDAPTYGSTTSSLGEIRFAAVPVQFPGETRTVHFVAIYLVDDEYAEVTGTVGNLVVVYVAVVLVAAAVGWLLLGQLLSPLRELRAATVEVGDTELDRRIPVRGNDEISELARRFNGMLDRLQQAFASQRELLDDVGHELRTPVTIVRGHLEMVDPDDPEDVRSTRVLLLDELDRMSRLVDDLITLARSERPDFVVTAMVDVTLLTDEVAEKLTALAPRSWRVDALAEGSAMLDRDRLTQAVVQLASNAVRHTSGGDVVAVGSRRVGSPDGDRLQLWVRDTGPGIDPADQARIFQRFSRGSGAARDSGTGLGLAIVQAIAAGHGGSLQLRSVPGEGATFVLDLPWYVAAEHVDQPLPETPDLPRTQEDTPRTGAPA